MASRSLITRLFFDDCQDLVSVSIYPSGSHAVDARQFANGPWSNTGNFIERVVIEYHVRGNVVGLRLLPTPRLESFLKIGFGGLRSIRPGSA